MSIFDKCCPIPKTVVCMKPVVAIYIFAWTMLLIVALRGWYIYVNEYHLASFVTVANAFFTVAFYAECSVSVFYVFGIIHYMTKASRKSIKKSVPCFGWTSVYFLFTVWLRYVICAVGIKFYYYALFLNIALTYNCLLVLISGIAYGKALETHYAGAEYLN